ncbi:MAG TPA: aspartate aminotransferase family protein, partial [Acidimicrobiales bacterium]|nr:aspartate aminotransferase family protein [Acidimicrobiales bacterium]
SGNPLATAAGLAVLDLLDDDAYEGLRTAAETLAAHLRTALSTAGVTAHVPVASTLVGLYLGDPLPSDYAGAKATDEAGYAKLFHALLDAGVALAPGAYEVMFPGLAHTPEVLDELATAFADAIG